MIEQSTFYLDENEDKFWYLPSKGQSHLHRIGAAAVEQADGTKAWFVNGKQHRIDGPSIEWIDGTKEWCVDGKQHRADGPAVEWHDGLKEWWVNGNDITKEVEEWIGKHNIDINSDEGKMRFKLVFV